MNLTQYDDTFDFFCEQLISNTSKVLGIGRRPVTMVKYVLAKRPDMIFFEIDRLLVIASNF